MVCHSTIAARVTMTLLHVSIVIPLFMTVALPARFVRAAAPVQPSEEDPFSEAVRTLYQHWDSAYGLQAENTFPPSAISLPPDVPPAPHLEDCEARTAFRLSTEKWGKRGEPPFWAVPNPACGNVPQPPWIRGSDAGNLAATRQAQADIWRQQFPPRQCKGRRVMLVEWLSMGWHGIGSQLHVMGAVLSAALLHNRTLVLVPGTLPQANHEECEKLGRRGSLDCYFFRFSSQECEEIALKARQAWKAAEERKQQAAAEEKEREERERGEKEREENGKGEEQAPGGGGGSGKGGARDSKEEGGEKVRNGGGRRLLQAEYKTGDAEVSHADNTTYGADGTGDNNKEFKRDVTNEDVIVAEPCDGVGCLGSDALVIFPATPGFGVDGGSNFISQLNVSAADLWGKAYLKSPLPNEVMGRMSKHSKFLKKAHWWRAQATRFMLRWPSAYLCHIINRERHHVYGMHVARQVVASHMDLRTLLLGESRESNKSAGEVGGFGGRGRLPEERQLLATQVEERSLLGDARGSSKSAEELGGVEGRGRLPEERQLLGSQMEQRSMLGESWGRGKPSRFPQKALKREQYGWDAYLANYEGVGGEPYVPRPIVSVHVRQGDKGIEMQLFSFYAFMFMANRIRRGFPGVRYAWLSTEMQVRRGEKGVQGRGGCRGEGGAGERWVQGRGGCRGEAVAGERRLQGRGGCRGEAGAGERRVQGRGGCRGEAGAGERRVQGRGECRGEAGAGERRVQGRGGCRGEAGAGERRVQGRGGCRGEAGAGERRVQGRGECRGEAGAGERRVQGRGGCRGEAGAGERRVQGGGGCRGEAGAGERRVQGRGGCRGEAGAGERRVQGRGGCRGEAGAGERRVQGRGGCRGEAGAGERRVQGRGGCRGEAGAGERRVQGRGWEACR
ncbi:unnamed protein product [Closterium sp. NIES-64]|nr:unnamed protein product [Closterium sp. NIES-64]